MSQQTDTPEVYKESDTHVPSATAQYGTLDTSGTAGAAHAKLEGITPVFAVADAQNALVAAAALDPEQPDVPSYLVTMPPGQNLVPVDVGAIEDRIKAQGEAAKDAPVTLGGPNSFQAQAATEGAYSPNPAAATATPAPGPGTAPAASTGTPQQQKPAAGTQS